MQFSKIAGPLRLDSADDGTLHSYRLSGRPGGSSCKVIQYMVKVFRASSDTMIGVTCLHGPDGEIYVDLNDPIPLQGATAPTVLIGSTGSPDVDPADIVGEWTLPVLRIQASSGTSAVSAQVELYELRKPF